MTAKGILLIPERALAERGTPVNKGVERGKMAENGMKEDEGKGEKEKKYQIE